MNEYTAKSIKVLSTEEAEENFVFNKIQKLIEEYPSTSPVFISNLIEATYLAGCPVELVIKRYLDKDKTIKVPTELYEIFAELADQRWR